MQELLCLDCAKRVMGYPDDLDPGYNSSFIEGTVIERVPGIFNIHDLDTGEVEKHQVTDTICDSCGTLQKVGTTAIGWTMWPAWKEDGVPTGMAAKPAWEHEMLKDMKTVKSVIRLNV